MAYVDDFQRIHFIGVGGVSMSALAKFALRRGREVSGSDRSSSEYFLSVLEEGGRVYLGENPDGFPKDALVVYNSAISARHPELIEARRVGQTVVDRKTFLADVESTFKKKIAVSGTHGKTTVTSLITEIFCHSDISFCAHIGGVPIGRSNLVYRGDDVFVTEACEYQRNFLSLSPTDVVITSVEMDHPDTYKNLEEVRRAFHDFAKKPSVERIFVPNTFADEYMHLCPYKHIVTYGKGGKYRVDSVFPYDHTTEFRLVTGKEDVVTSTVLKGKYNLDNIAAAAAVAVENGVSPSVVATAVSSFKGVKRRFELKGHLNSAPVYVDYAHHPSEISGVITTASASTRGRLFVVFQPHTYSRTAELFDDFAGSFGGADVLFFTASYSAREDSSKGLTAYDLYKKVKRDVMFCRYCEKLRDVAISLIGEVKKDDAVLILGAGDVDVLAPMIVDEPV